MRLLGKLTPKAWRERPPYGAIALIVAAILFLAGGYYYNNGYVSRVLTAVATASMGVWVTLEVVQWVLKKDREDRGAHFRFATYGLFADYLVDILIGAAGAILMDREIAEAHLKKGRIAYISFDLFAFLLDVTEKVVTTEIKLSVTTPIKLSAFYSYAEYSLIALSDRMPIRIMATEDKNLIQNMAEVELRIIGARGLRAIHKSLAGLNDIDVMIVESKKISESDALEAIKEIKQLMIACCGLYLAILSDMGIDTLDGRKRLDYIERTANYDKQIVKRDE